MQQVKVLRMFATIAALSFLCVVISTGQEPIGQGLGGPGGGMRSPVLDPSVNRTPVQAGKATGFLYAPKLPGEKSHIGIFVMHYGADYSNFSTCYELSKRGYTVLCTKNAGGNLNSILLDAKSSIEYLRKVPGVQKVILWGHSGGAVVMSSYETIAENGVKSCQGPEKLAKCPDYLANMQPADGLFFADANWGVAMEPFALDPAVISEGNGVNLDPDLDIYNPKFGFNAKGNSDYSQEFVRKFQKALAKRENALIKHAQDRVAAIEAGKGNFTDDEPMVVAGAATGSMNNKLFPQDVKLMAHTVKAWPLIHTGGSVTNEVVHSVRVPAGVGGAFGGSGGPGGGAPQTGKPFIIGRFVGGALNTTVRNFLLEHCLRMSDDFYYDEDSVHGMDWTSSYASTPGNIMSIHIPSIFLGMTGNFEYLAAETIYNNSAAKDKSLGFIEGATHTYQTCKQCETTPGQFGDTIKTLYDYADKWLSQKGRFM